MARIDVLTERPIGLVDPGVFGCFAGSCPEADLRAAERDLGATSMRWATRPDKPWCGEAEPVLVLDMAAGTLDDALAWVECCSGTYGVRYWGLGRDMHDGRRTAAEYVTQAMSLMAWPRTSTCTAFTSTPVRPTTGLTS